jgi:glycine/D-amino acid oxidase-like deaminating enzyme
MKVIIVGNGILGLMTAYRLISRDLAASAWIIGPQDRKGCASLAAAAMFNSFCEVDPGTLSNEYETARFVFNMASNRHWPPLLERIEKESGVRVPAGFGTFLINNHATDSLEDETFDAVLDALRRYEEPHEMVRPADIPRYRPAAKARAARAVFLPREGWVNPRALLEALSAILVRSGRVEFVDGYCRSLQRRGDGVEYVQLENGERVTGEWFLLAPGATFSRIVERSNLELEMPRIFYGIGCSVLLATAEATLTHCVRTPNRGLACGVYAAPQTDSQTLIGASNLIAPEPEEHARVTSVHALLQSAMEQISADYYRSQILKVNVGWRPTSEDTLPLLGATSIQNLLVATGTKRDGFHCSPVISELLVDLMLGSGPKIDVRLFQPERKPVRLYSREKAIAATVRHTLNAAYQHGFTPSKDRMVEDLQRHYRLELERLHDDVGALDWGIPPEMVNMYKYGHAR